MIPAVRALIAGVAATLLQAAPSSAAPACKAVLTGGETEFAHSGHVPDYLSDDCFTFTVPQGKHVRMNVTREGAMSFAVSVKDPESNKFLLLVAPVTSFSNAAPTGRFVQAETDTAPKELEVYVGSDKREPDTSKEYTFRIVLEPAVPPEPPRRSVSDRVLRWFGLR